MSDVKVWCNICNEIGDHIAPNCPKIKVPHGFGFYDLAKDRQMILCDEGAWSGWLFYQHPDGQWVSLRKATDADIASITKQLVAAGWPTKKWQQKPERDVRLSNAESSDLSD